jgi:hypothetical protein
MMALAISLAIIAGVARAQIDTPASAEARAALRGVQEAYGRRVEWPQWSRLLNVPDVKYELRAGDRAERRVLQTAIVELVGGRVPQFVEPAFERLAKALDVCAQELVLIPADQWPTACRAQAENYAPVTPETLEAARAAFERRMDRFEDDMPTVRQQGDRWNAFLFWRESRDLATPPRPASPPDLAALDRLETRWAAAPAVWDDDQLFETSLAARQYVRMLRSYLKGETRAEHAAAWNELAGLLESDRLAGDDTSKIAAAVIGRERLGQSSRLTASIRRELSHPNLILQVSTKWLESRLSSKIDEPYDVNDVFAGSRSVGRGRLAGTMSGVFLPSNAVGQWELRVRGTSAARTYGGEDRVSVTSRAVTQIAGTKPFFLDVVGLAPQRAWAGANTSITYESINASGFARRRQAAISETYARRPQAEAESAAYARRSILERMNGEAAKVSADFNKRYHEQFRDPRLNSGRPGPEVRVRTADGLMSWECSLVAPDAFAAPAAPPPFDAGTDVVMSLGPSAMEEQGTMALGGKEMTAEDLAKVMGPASSTAQQKPSEEFNVTFEADPCDIRFHEGRIHARLYVAKFDSADVKYPAMTVDVAYQPLERDGKVVFVRQGRVRVRPRAADGEDKPTISGRQQTLRVAVERKLAKVLTEELQWDDVKLPLGEDDDTTLRLERVQLAAQWLQIGLAPQEKLPPPARTATRAR